MAQVPTPTVEALEDLALQRLRAAENLIINDPQRAMLHMQAATSMAISAHQIAINRKYREKQARGEATEEENNGGN